MKHTYTALLSTATLSVLCVLSMIDVGSPALAQTTGGSCVQPPAGLVSWWPGDGNANDIQDGNNGTPQNGAAFAAGNVGQAFSLNGAGAFIDTGNAFNLHVSAGDFSVDGWVFFNVLGGDMSIVDKMSASGVNTDGWRLLKQNDNHFWFCFGGGGGNNGCTPSGATTVISTTTATTGVWFHVTAVKSSTEIAIYVNGVKEASKPPSAFADTNSANLRIGSYAGAGAFPGAYLNGLVDEIQVFNRALSLSEIQAIFNASSAGQCKNMTACQVNVTRLGQCRLFNEPPDPDPGVIPGWPSGTSALDQYASRTDFLGGGTVPGTICLWGCALTSLSMALNQAGMTLIPDCRSGVCRGGPILSNDPGSVNRFLKVLDLYAPINNVDFDVATRWLASALNLPKAWYFDDFSHGGEIGSFASSGSPCVGNACQTLDDYLCATNQPVPVIVRVVGADGVFGNHKVLVIGKQGEDYLINDPANQHNTGVPRHTLLSQYTYCGPTPFGTFACSAPFTIVGVVKDPSGDVSGLDLATDTNAELLVIDSSARRTGFDSISGKDVKEIPNSTHFLEATDDEQTGTPPTDISHIVHIFQPLAGNYHVQVEGLHLGTYSLVIRAFSQDGSPQPPLIISGIAAPGSMSTLQVQFNSPPGSVPQVTRVATFSSTLDDISNALQLGLIDNQGIANSLSKKIEAASDAASKGKVQTAKNILDAFLNEVSAQAGKHVTGIAPQVLSEDAESLTRQIS